jgi:Tfp pilus assembly protein PilO
MKNKFIAIGVVGGLLLAGVWFFFLWGPQGDSLDKARDDRAAAEQRAQGLEQRLAHLRELEKNAPALEALRTRLAAYIPDTDQLDTFILQLNEQAVTSGVRLASLSPTEPVATAVPAAATANATPNGDAAGTGAAAPVVVAAPPSIGLSIQVAGDYFAVMRFLETLRDGSRLVVVDQVTMSPSDGTAVTATIGAKMFLGGLPGATPAGTAAATTGGQS